MIRLFESVRSHYLPNPSIQVELYYIHFPTLEAFKLSPVLGLLCILENIAIFCSTILMLLCSKQQRCCLLHKNSSTALLQVEVDRSRTSTPLKDLLSQTLYTVGVSAVYDEGESPPVTAQETTRKL